MKQKYVTLTHIEGDHNSDHIGTLTVTEIDED